MVFWLVLGFLNVAVPFNNEEHDIHVSVCDIDISGSKMEVVLKTFLDDLQLALNLEPGQPLPDTYSSANEMIFDYVNDQLSIITDGQRLQLSLDDISSSGDAIWITMKHTSERSINPANIILSNALLTEVYEDQTNLVNFRTEGGKRSFILDRKKKEVGLAP